ncbi:UDP-N-acetylmuramate--L-alanine ligase [Bogoriella caseilytica]|uniref:UDP-N-acetylmuramate--L-alanine ligase n=1 Tax=Bogoriella caseilytica TaxID=56055 RepID=A0A3N2B9F9_9MICO|nr:UDP-N-acetylmuramate--L-alanine ligase [Bogoriella caseilytica]ROR71838.1 UDP-N-acetylmuramate--L-alanine ligase [Bogoriella caseilytica]
MSEPFHFLGIGGAGMSAIAELLAAAGHQVSGSDQAEGPMISHLRRLGITAHVGHDADHVAALPESATVVVSTAVRETNPELVAARARGLAVIHRSAALARAAADRDFVAVAGAHGKTSTSAMLAVALEAAGQQPSYAIGGTVMGRGTGAHLGQGRAFVAEADESDGSFLNYRPRIAVVTNIEPDHLDHYGSEEAFRRSFEEFTALIEPGGLLVACADDAGAAALARHAAAAGTRVITYGGTVGLAEAPGIEAHVMLGGDGTLTLRRPAVSDAVATLHLQVPGRHMLLNATAAWTAGVELGVEPQAMAAALGVFTGTGRRFESRGTVAGIRVVDDYAHHPTEIEATLITAREQAGRGRVVALFQPHLYSRTQAFAERFAQALSAADVVVVTDVYAAREDPIPGVDGALITSEIEGARYVADRHAAARTVADEAEPGDLLLTIGAGDVTELVPEILDRLRGREEAQAGSA